jgi:hypothetical protein
VKESITSFNIKKSNVPGSIFNTKLYF